MELTKAQKELFFENQDKRIKIIPKGRRFGFTQGASLYTIIEASKGKSVLWGDTTYSNINRYIEQYFVKYLKELEYPFDWQKSRFQLKIGAGSIDFRSADYPKNWEGFDYDLIILNEAGIILKNEYLWYNAVLPMMLKKGVECKLIAGGTPKGKPSLYYELSKNPDYWVKTYTTYDNPLMSREAIEQLKQDMPIIVQKQEIYGEFVSIENALIKPEYIKIGDIEGDTVIGVDLAFSKKTNSDYTAVVVASYDKDGKIGIKEVYRDKIGLMELKRKLEYLNEKHNPIQIRIESIAGQVTTAEELIRTTNLPIYKVYPKGDKVVRFMPILAKYEQGLIYHSTDLPKYFERELLEFPNSSHDDMIDALSYTFTNRREIYI